MYGNDYILVLIVLLVLSLAGLGMALVATVLGLE